MDVKPDKAIKLLSNNLEHHWGNFGKYHLYKTMRLEWNGLVFFSVINHWYEEQIGHDVSPSQSIFIHIMSPFTANNWEICSWFVINYRRQMHTFIKKFRRLTAITKINFNLSKVKVRLGFALVLYLIYCLYICIIPKLIYPILITVI